MPEKKSKPQTVRLEQTHPCGVPVRVDGHGTVRPGETIEVTPEVAERLLRSAKTWRRAQNSKGPAAPEKPPKRES